jgi:putative flippase GtrA
MSGTGGVARFVRYCLGSVAATAASAVVFAGAYHFLALGPRVASVSAFVAGMLVNFVGNRYWAWNRRTRRNLGRDAIAYAIVAVVFALAAAGVTTATDSYARAAHIAGTDRTLLVEGSYFATYAAMFVVKFVLLDRLVFRPGRATAESGGAPATR